MKLKPLFAGLALATAAIGVTVAQTSQTTPAAPAAQAQTIAQVVAADPQFSTLLTALKAAGLDQTLAGTGPFTVFAPTNAAFAKVPKADLDKLLADKAALTRVLTYHVVSGKVPAADVVKLGGKGAKTVQGQEVMVAVSGSNVTLNGNARVTRTDVMASNGVIHVIDTVLMPKAQP